MPTISFNQQTTPLNVSIQPTDILYAVESAININTGFTQSGSNTTVGNNKPQAYGEVTGVDRVANTIEVDTSGYSSYTTTPNTFFFFSKNRSVNSSGLLGYYSLVEYRNYSKKEAEIFAVGTEYAPSSK